MEHTKERWQPIETAPKDGTYVLLGNADGVWIGVFKSPFQSGFQPGNPWFSLMLNHRHMEKRNRNWSSVPTHWMPLPAVPKVGAGETAKPVAWIRFCSDGCYEGPIMDEQIEDVRKNSGAWTPLYARHNVELTGSRAALSPVSPATEGSEVERRVGGGT